MCPPTDIQHEINADFDGPETLPLHPYFPFDRFHSLVQNVLNARQQCLVIDTVQLLQNTRESYIRFGQKD